MFNPVGDFRSRLFRRSFISLRRRIRRPLSRITTIVLIICFLSSSTPADPRLIRDLAIGTSARFYGLVDGLLGRLRRKPFTQNATNQGMPQSPLNAPPVNPERPRSRVELEARVASLQVTPGTVITLESRQRMLFSALPVDANGAVIHGLHAAWTTSDRNVVFVRRNGEAIAGRPGVAILTAGIALIRQTVTVTVLAGSLDLFGGKPKTDSLRSSLQTRNSSGAQQRSTRSSAPKRNHMVMVPQRPPNQDALPDNETYSLYQASNAVGSPPGKKKPGAMTPAVATNGTENGNKNFNFGLPIVSLPGRGVDASLSLIYNSQVWNKSTDPNDNSTWLTFDVDSGWPAPGFRLGYGQIESQGSLDSL